MSTKPIRPPKIPPTERVDEVYNALKKGLQSCLQVHQTDLDNINKEIKKSKLNSRLGFLNEFDQQAKVTETYMGTLEVHFCKTEQIYESYREKRKLRDEASNVIKACKASPGTKEVKERLVKANHEHKKYSEDINVKEKELQKQLGEFSIKMKGLAGFARLCAGDQYEILIKYGRQRWKMHGSIEVNAKQTWDNEHMVFYPIIQEFIYVKVTELKRVANHVVIGNIFCEPVDLFTPLPRTVAVNVNESGTIKLVLEVTWNPVSGPCPTLRPGSRQSLSPGSPQSLPPGSPPSLPPSPPASLPPSPTSFSPSPDPSRGSGSSVSLEPVLFSRPPKEVCTPLQGIPLSENPVDPPAHVKPQCWPRDGVLADNGLQDALEILIFSLDEYTGHFADLKMLEVELKLLQETLRDCRNSPPPSRASGSSVDTQIYELGDPAGFTNGYLHHQTPPLDTPPLHRGRAGSSTPLTTGCTRLDSSLVIHLQNCSARLMHLAVSGPLQCRATYALDKLLREARVFKIIHHIIRDDPHRLKHPAEVIPELDLCGGVVPLWERCVGDSCLYCVSAKTFMSTLSTLYSSMLSERADMVLSCLVERVLEQRFPQRGNRDGPVVTLFQLWSYLESNGISDMEFHIIALTEEVELVQNLLSRDQDVIVETLHLPSECSLQREGMQTMAKLLTDPRQKVSASASSVLRILAGQHKQREQALVNCLEMLEDDEVDTRVCGCKALACLKATESIEQLTYLCETDNEEVKKAAVQTLLELGDEGKMALRRLELAQDVLPDSLLLEPWPDRPSTSTYRHRLSTEL